MNDPVALKPWYASKTINGGLLVIIPLILALFHKQLSAADLGDLANLITIIICTAAPIIVWFGRTLAGGIGKAPAIISSISLTEVLAELEKVQADYAALLKATSIVENASTEAQPSTSEAPSA